MGFERKFKDGDKVKVIDSNSSSYKEIGTIKWYGYPLYLKDSFYKKKIYHVDFKTYSHEFYSHQLEKVEDNATIKIPKELSWLNQLSAKGGVSYFYPASELRVKLLFEKNLFPLVKWYKTQDGLNYSVKDIKTFKGIKKNNNYNKLRKHKNKRI